MPSPGFQSGGHIQQATYSSFPRLLLCLALLLTSLGTTLVAAPRARAERLWTPAAPMTQTHLDHTATLLRDGTVLVAGGYFDTNGPLAERYDPAADRWSPAGRLAVQRFQQTATLLNDGRVLVVGGATYQAELPQDDTLGRAELYDPATSTWSLTEPVAPQRLAPDGLTGHTATLLPDGRVLVVGGAPRVFDQSGREIGLGSSLYDPATGHWTDGAPTLDHHVFGTATLLHNGQVLLVGGDTATTELYDPATNRWTPTGALHSKRSYHCAVLLPDGSVLVIGGAETYPVSTNLVERYNPATGQWNAAAPLATPRAGHTATLLPDGKVLVTGGAVNDMYAGASLATTELYDPAANQWSAGPLMTAARRRHAATLLADGHVLVSGGAGAVGAFLNSAERYGDLPAQCFSQTGQCLSGRFLAYWLAHGGLARNGYPLTGERLERLEDGHEYLVQYCERVRLEYHPENAGTPYEVLLGQFGWRLHPADPPTGRIAGQRYFVETGHNLGSDFLAYWEDNGGLAQFGYPLTEEFPEQLEDGNAYVVQYFERARFEHHPENQPPYNILLGQFGRRILAGVAPPPPPPLVVVNGFGALYNANAAVRERLGRPTTNERAVPGATQPFERGRMVYLGDTKTILVLGEWPNHAGSEGDWSRYPDTWTEDQPASGGPGPQPGLYQPQRGFGKLWRENYYGVQSRLGYATTPTEQALTLALQFFEHGAMLYGMTSDGPTIYVLYDYAPDGSSGHYERYAASP